MGTVLQTFETFDGTSVGSFPVEVTVLATGNVKPTAWSFLSGTANQFVSFPAQTQALVTGATITIALDWYVTTVSTGSVNWIVKLVAEPPNSATSLELSDNATSVNVTTAAPAVGNAYVRSVVNVSGAGLDGVQQGDRLWVVVSRASGAPDTFGFSAALIGGYVAYSDGLAGTPGSGDFVGIASSTTGNIVSFGSTNGKLAADSGKAAASVVTGPASAVANNLAKLDATGKVISDAGVSATSLVTGPASAVANNLAKLDATGKVISDAGVSATNLVTNVSATGASEIAVFSDTTGKLIAGGGTTLGSVVKNTGPSVIDGNIVKFSGTGGLNILDGGVLAADVVAVAGESAGDEPRFNGTIWTPKRLAVGAATADFSLTAAINVLTDITGVVVTLPRAGTYTFQCASIHVLTGTAGAIYYAMNYTGTVTRIMAQGASWQTTGTGGATVLLMQIANNALVATTTNGGTSAIGTGGATMLGSITVSTTGTLSFRVARANAATTTAIKAGTCLTVMEA